MTLDTTPEPEEVVQSEETYVLNTPPIPAVICGPVQTREAPALRGAYQTVSNVGTGVGVRVLNYEPRRKSARILAVTGDVWISKTQQGAQQGASGSARLPFNQWVTITNIEELWACSVAGTTDISVITDFWSE